MKDNKTVYTYKDILENVESLKKLKATSMLPWENVRNTARYLRDLDRELELYNTQMTSLSFEYAKFGVDNQQKDKDSVRVQKRDDPECKPTHILLTQEGLTVEQSEKKDKATKTLLDTKTSSMTIPSIDSKVIEKLYNDSQDRRKKQDQAKEIDPNGEPFFGVDDVRAYEVLGLLKEE